MATNDLRNRINEQYRSMSKGQRLLAAFITDHYDQAAFLTALELGAKVGVSESTVVRFATSLGYKGYPEFQRALGAEVQKELNSADRMETSYGRLSGSKILGTMLKADRERIKKTMEQIDAGAFEQAVAMMAEARRVYVIGLRACGPVAEFLSYYLNLIRDQVTLLRMSTDNEIFEQMIRIGKDDCIVGISFPRYSMRTLKAMEFANERNAKVITITDNVYSPMNLYSSCNLIAASDTSSLIESMVAPMSVVNALLVSLAAKYRGDVSKNLEVLEEIWREYQTEGNDELDPVDDARKLRFTEFGETHE
ncbi:MAG: MurR/RpiR family transcriptional regulator [Lachnospiraceae bacterium]|nr:MurR/RpiR family transcriptional regulator [Lachnospiraceae bacterium]